MIMQNSINKWSTSVLLIVVMALAPSYRSLNMTQFTCIRITIIIQICSTIITTWNHAQNQSISVFLEDMSSGPGYVPKFLIDLLHIINMSGCTL